jgi:hypothetical protein
VSSSQAGALESFFLLSSFLFFLLLSRVARIGESGNAPLLIEERRRKPGLFGQPRFWLPSRRVAEFLGMGTHVDEKL